MTGRAEPSLAELTRVFARIGVLSFGGPAAQIAVMHTELVDPASAAEGGPETTRPWLSEAQFLNALSFCMLLPGPEAMQLATYCGWRLRGVLGGLIAGGLFVLPGAAVMMGLAGLYAAYGQVPLVEALFLGIKAAVVVIVLEALLKVSRRALLAPDRWVIAGLSFAAIFAFGLPFPLIIAAAAAYGAWAASSLRPGGRASPHGRGEESPHGLDERPRTLRMIALWLVLWWAPIGAVWLGGHTLLVELGLFFSKLAVVTFGGAYAVLAYMTQEVVQHQGWLSTAQMMDGLGLAETTPGPLILVTQFVGFLAGIGAGGWGLAVAAAALTLWVTFVPCFLWIFAGAPYIERISAQPRLAGALQAITAAVVGVILNLSLWFAAHVFFAQVGLLHLGPLTLLAPDLATLEWRAVLVAGLAGAALLWRHWGLGRVLVLSALFGALLNAPL